MLEGKCCCLFQNTSITDLQWQRLIFYCFWCYVPVVQRALSWQPNRPPGCAPVCSSHGTFPAITANILLLLFNCVMQLWTCLRLRAIMCFSLRLNSGLTNTTKLVYWPGLRSRKSRHLNPTPGNFDYPTPTFSCISYLKW